MKLCKDEVQKLFKYALNDIYFWKAINISKNIKYCTYQGMGYVFEVIDCIDKNIAYITFINDGIYQFTQSDEMIKSKLKDVYIIKDNSDMQMTEFYGCLDILNTSFDGNLKGWKLIYSEDILRCRYYDHKNNLLINIIQISETDSVISLIKNNIFYFITDIETLGILIIKMLECENKTPEISILSEEFGHMILTQISLHCALVYDDDNELYWKIKTNTSKLKTITLNMGNYQFNVIWNRKENNMYQTMNILYKDNIVIKTKVKSEYTKNIFFTATLLECLDIVINDDETSISTGEDVTSKSMRIFYECKNDDITAKITCEAIPNYDNFDFNSRYLLYIFTNNKKASIKIHEKIIRPRIDKIKEKL